MRRRTWFIIIAIELCALAALPVILWRALTGPAPQTPAPAAAAQAGEPATPPFVVEIVTVAVPTSAPTPAPTPEPSQYVVVGGDTMWNIAARFNIPLDSLFAANPSVNPDQLTPGQVLNIPPTPTPTAPAIQSLPDSPTPESLTPTPTRPGPVMGQVSADGGDLRLRETPGTAGGVIVMLDALTPLYIVGRTADSVWLEVIAPAGQRGWVMAKYVDLFVNAADLPVTGVAVDLPAGTPTAIAQLPQPTGTPTSFATATGAATQPIPSAQPTTTPPAAASPTALPPASPPPTATAGVSYPTAGVNGSYPFIANITDRAHQIFLAGQSLGNRADVFSKVGDSITVSPGFLTPIGNGQYNLRDYSNLQEVVNYFSQTVARDANSFANTSLAARGGWSAWTVINPYLSQSQCKYREKPLVCEYRLAKPSVALILLGTNDVKTTPLSTYETYMREVIQTSIDMGVIPVVSTIPEFHRTGVEGRVAAINGVVIALSNEYSIPLWDYWGALRGLPNDGLSADGIHPSVATGHAADFTAEFLQYGMTVRNLTALQALDAVWRGALYP